jgi:acyl-CoA thioester hydrolase
MNLTKQSTANITIERWFEHPVTVFPHHTDYGGMVWHGTYLTWLEEARVECLKSIGVAFADFVLIGCDMPVIDISLRYHQALRLGDTAIVKTKMNLQGIKIKWEYKIQSLDLQTTYVTGMITLVPIDHQKGKIMRQLPPMVKDALSKLNEQ